MTCYRRGKREESHKNPSSAICEANTDIRATCGKKGTKVNSAPMATNLFRLAAMRVSVKSFAWCDFAGAVVDPEYGLLTSCV